MKYLLSNGKKPTAKNIAEYVNEHMNRPKGGNNLGVFLPNLNKHTLESLRDNYNFKTVRREFLGYVYFER